MKLRTVVRGLQASALFFSVAFIAGDLRTLLAASSFGLGIVLPLGLVVRSIVGRGQARNGESVLTVAGFLTLPLLVPLYLLRKVIPLPAPSSDIAFSAALWMLAWSVDARRKPRRAIRSLEASRPELWWLAVVLPFLFSVVWLGYEVKSGDSVQYFGLYFVDFGNLLSIQNLVRVSPGLPQSPLIGGGPLGYHWFFFAAPAWASEFLAIGARPASTLMLSNLAVASCLYLELVRVTSGLTAMVGAGPSVAAHLSGTSLLGLSTLYPYQWISSHLGEDWLSLGKRNSLLLQLPHGLTCFGNNTAGLGLCLITFALLSRWSESRRTSDAVLAASATSILPAYSITLVLPLTLAVFIHLSTRPSRISILLLGVFGGIGLLLLGVFKYIGLFSYAGDSGGFVVTFDQGQFLQNVVLGFLPLTYLVFVWCLKCRNSVARPYLTLGVSSLAVPTILMTKGTPTSAVDLSMKTASLCLIAFAPLCVQASAWLLVNGERYKLPFLLGVLGLCGGLGNSAIYAFQHGFHRLTGKVTRFHSIERDHYRALTFVSSLPPELSLVDQNSITQRVANPSVMIGAKRVAVSSGYEDVAFSPPSQARTLKEHWLRWQESGFSDEHGSKIMAAGSDLLITTTPQQLVDWEEIGRFGRYRVLRSRLRTAAMVNVD